MAQSPAFQEWQLAEQRMQAAVEAYETRYRAGQRPTTEQLDELQALRAAASEALKAMVAEAKAMSPPP